jgi:hypothetical protein
MMVCGLAEVATAFTHDFFGLTTMPATLSTVLGAAIGALYVWSGLLVLSRKRRAAIVAILLLIADVLGRIAMVVTGLYPSNSIFQAFAIIVGTSIVMSFAIYIWLNREYFT